MLAALGIRLLQPNHWSPSIESVATSNTHHNENGFNVRRPYSLNFASIAALWYLKAGKTFSHGSRLVVSTLAAASGLVAVVILVVIVVSAVAPASAGLVLPQHAAPVAAGVHGLNEPMIKKRTQGGESGVALRRGRGRKLRYSASNEMGG